jgi:hypothetical protein
VGTWNVDIKTEPGVLRIKLAGALTVEEANAFVTAHRAAVKGFAGLGYAAWVDLSELSPMRPEVADVVESAKRHSTLQANFRGSAVLVSGATVAMQTRRMAKSSGSIVTELISEDSVALREHLRTLMRPTP